MAKYYKVDHRKISLREFWNISHTWKVLIPWAAARLGVQMGGGNCFRLPDSVRELEVPEAEFFGMARMSLQPLLEEALRLGFHSPRFYSFESLKRDVRTSFISLLHRSGDFSIRLMHTASTLITPPKERRLLVLMTELNDGTYLVTSNERQRFRSAPGIVVQRRIGAPLAQLVEAHEQCLAESRWQNPAKPVRSQEALEEVWDRYEKYSTGFGIKRGLYVEMSPEELADEQHIVTTANTMAAANPENADVLMQLAALQNKKTGWRRAIWLLIISAFLFAFAGSHRWSWNYVLIIVPVLFVHELGHYVTMRIFRYQNLRMFFIPFFGAAVSGRHFNVAGWKKAIVSLMGPVPGIVLGAAAGGLGLMLHNTLLTKIAMMALILNGFNLLPILPFDGGWVFHALLFSRHHLFDAVFRVVAAIGLAVVGLLSGSKILLYLTVPMLMAIPAAYRNSKIAADIRSRGLPPVSPDDQTIPAETANAIIAEVKKTMPTKAYTTKMVAERTLQVFEMVNARPPQWPATIGLLFVHLASIGLAVLVSVALVFGQDSRLKNLVASLTATPERPLVSSVVPIWQGNEAGEGTPITIVAHFKNMEQAQSFFTTTTNRLPETARLEQIGETLLLNLPNDDSAARKKWFAEFNRKASSAFVVATNSDASFAVICTFPTEEQAKAVDEELREYLDTDLDHSLIPPWLPDDPRSSEQRAAHQLARQSFLKAQHASVDSGSDAKLLELREQFYRAFKAHNTGEIAKLRQQMEQRELEAAAERREQLKQGTDGAIDPVVVDLYGTYITDRISKSPAADVRQELAQRMGQMPKFSEEAAKVDRRYGTIYGISSKKEKTVEVSWVTFTQLTDGAPALVRWLGEKGGGDFKYDIVSEADVKPGE